MLKSLVILLCGCATALGVLAAGPDTGWDEPVGSDAHSTAGIVPPRLVEELLADPAVKIEDIICVALPNNPAGHPYETFGYRANLPKQFPTSVGELVGGVGGGRLVRMNLRSGLTQTILEDAGGAIRDPCVYVEVPALRALQFIALDAGGLGIKRMHAFTSVMPGERRRGTSRFRQHRRPGLQPDPVSAVRAQIE